MAPVWVQRPRPTAADGLIAAGLAPTLAVLLARRGVATAAEAAAHAQPSPEDLHPPDRLAGLGAGVDLLVAARTAGHRVAVVGDYDVDGIAATALLVATLRALGIATEPILPSRRAGGYGLQPAHVERAVAAGAGLLVTVDCGMQAHEALAVAATHALPVIVTDHHLPGPVPPAAAAVVNPRQPGCAYPFRDLAGSGVALKLALALFDRCRRQPPLEALLRVACLGTIADAVPLVGENRTIARLGLEALPATRSPGLLALFRSAQLGDRIRGSDVAFRIAPRLNAAGRVGDPEPALELLLTRDAARGRELAARLEEANRLRQNLEQRVLADCAELGEGASAAPIFVAWSAAWEKGVVGIAAGRLAKELNRPVILFACEADGLATGSGRSVEGFDLHQALAPHASALRRFGGHAQAVGLTVESARLPALRERWIEELSGAAELRQREQRLEYDLSLSARDADVGLAEAVSTLEPYGSGSPEPVFRLGPLTLRRQPRRFGDGHLALSAVDPHGDTCEIVAWRWRRREEPWSGAFEILAALEVDRWQGPPTARLRLVAARSIGSEQVPRHRMDVP